MQHARVRITLSLNQAAGAAVDVMAMKSTLQIKIDQHSPGGKRLQAAVQEKLKEYMGPDYSDEVTSGTSPSGGSDTGTLLRS